MYVLQYILPQGGNDELGEIQEEYKLYLTSQQSKVTTFPYNT